MKPISIAENKDCMDVLPGFGEKFFDIAIVDPPFGIGNFVQTSGNVRGESVDWNNNIPNNLYFYLLRKVSKHQIIFGANYYNQFDEVGGAIIWVKNQPMPNFSKAVIASCSFHKKIEVYEQTWTNYVNTKRTNHPCEMPVALYQWILKNYAKPGDKILDTHMGSQGSRIAAYLVGLDYWGFEISEEYYNEGCKSFEKAIAEPLFEPVKLVQSSITFL